MSVRKMLMPLLVGKQCLIVRFHYYLPRLFTCGGDVSSVDNGPEGQDVVSDEGVSARQTPSKDVASVSGSVPDPMDQSSSPESEDSPATSGLGKLASTIGKFRNKGKRQAPYSKDSRHTNLKPVASDKPLKFKFLTINVN